MVFDNKNVPEPFRHDEFLLLQKGIFNDQNITVFINSQNDFACLHPRPVTDYKNYMPRYKQLKITKDQTALSLKRYKKVAHVFRQDINSLVEIGAAEGYFLAAVKKELPHIALAAVEPNKNAAELLRTHVAPENHFENIDLVCSLGKKYDVVCFFHVFEHIIHPGKFLEKIRTFIHSKSVIIIEIPSLFDPLLSLYGCKSYYQFYFQSQHPYVYSPPSLSRLMEFYGFETKEVIDYQRYGIENHLNWLINESPGESESLKGIFTQTNEKYIMDLENNGKTDTVFWIGHVL
jgi:hypothetical protein